MAFPRLTMLTLIAQALSTTYAATTPLPSYALKYAPYSYLASDEAYWPSDIATHLQHVFPSINKTAIAPSTTLSQLSGYPNNTFLTSMDDVFDQDAPDESWITSLYGKPGANGLSAAPATIIAVPKAGNVVDVFYFMFYSWDLGTTFLDIRFGNHVGDWEHQMVRFISGVPTAVYLSAHSAGTAHTFTSLPKAPGTTRPITYIAKGTHANYATAGSQPYPVPVIGPITDSTSQGPLWDTTLNYRGYWFDVNSTTFTAAGGAGQGGAEQANETPSWLTYRGAWGDDLPSTDILKNAQYCISTECHFVAGPTGPIDKNLGRRQPCQDESKCTVATSAKMVAKHVDFRAHLDKLADAMVEAQDRGLFDGGSTKRNEL